MVGLAGTGGRRKALIILDAKGAIPCAIFPTFCQLIGRLPEPGATVVFTGTQALLPFAGKDIADPAPGGVADIAGALAKGSSYTTLLGLSNSASQLILLGPGPPVAYFFTG